MDQLDLLRLFIAIADTGSLSAVARTRSISPSTVTLGLQRLEERVGARLVTRTTRNLSLTPEGESFLADCRRILGDLSEAMDGVADRGPLQGMIRVTATNDFGRNRLAPLTDSFMRAHPGVRFALLLTDAVVDLVGAGYDLALRVGEQRDDAGPQRLLLKGRQHICAAPDYWDRAGRPRHPRELALHNCMVLSRPAAPQTSWHFCEGRHPFSVRVAGDRAANDGGALRGWAIAGAGVVRKSSFDIADDVAAGRLETVLEEYAEAEMNLYAVQPPGRGAARRVAAFVEHLAANL